MNTAQQDAVMNTTGVRIPGAWKTTRNLPLHAVWLGAGRVWQFTSARGAVAAQRAAYDAGRS